MASSTAIEECKHGFTSPCPQVGCLHESTAEYDERGQVRTLITSLRPDLPRNLKPCEVPDPASRCPAAASSAPERGAGHLEGDGGKPWEREPDKYVLMTHYQPTYDGTSTFRIITSQTPILISSLRPCEQNVAYESQLSRAPKHKYPDHHALHSSRLIDVRAAIADETADFERERSILGLAREAALEARDAGCPGTEWLELMNAEEAVRACLRAAKHREKLMACEQGVVRLLKRCEELLGGGEAGVL